MLVNLVDTLRSKSRSALKDIISREKRGADTKKQEVLVKKAHLMKILIPFYTDAQIETLYSYVRRKL